MVECTRLESEQSESSREFESLRLRFIQENLYPPLAGLPFRMTIPKSIYRLRDLPSVLEGGSQLLGFREG